MEKCTLKVGGVWVAPCSSTPARKMAKGKVFQFVYVASQLPGKPTLWQPLLQLLLLRPSLTSEAIFVSLPMWTGEPRLSRSVLDLWRQVGTAEASSLLRREAICSQSLKTGNVKTKQRDIWQH